MKKEEFEDKVNVALLSIADYMVANLENNLHVGKAITIRQPLKLNMYVFNEAMGD